MKSNVKNKNLIAKSNIFLQLFYLYLKIRDYCSLFFSILANL